MEGNFAWLGEPSECQNITAFNGNWSAHYALVTKPTSPLDFFRPQNGFVI